jgi:nicotinamidase-related amidase
MKKILFIIDAQNDFCSQGGSLLCKNAESAVGNICDLLETHDFDEVVCTIDTHDKNYLETKEGEMLPVEHCIYGTHGCLLNKNIYDRLYRHKWSTISKNSFMMEFDDMIELLDVERDDYEIYVCGFATDICVLNNALLLKNTVGKWNDGFGIENCCAITSSEIHDKAIEVMKTNLIKIVLYDIGQQEFEAKRH